MLYKLIINISTKEVYHAFILYGQSPCIVISGGFLLEGDWFICIGYVIWLEHPVERN